MSEERYRANLLSATVDKIEIVNETLTSVDVIYDRSYGDRPAHTIRREAKETAYSRICKTKLEAWQAIDLYATEQLVLAEQAIRRWANAKAAAETQIAESAD